MAFLGTTTQHVPTIKTLGTLMDLVFDKYNLTDKQAKITSSELFMYGNLINVICAMILECFNELKGYIRFTSAVFLN